MFLRPHPRSKDGKNHIYWSLVETVRTADGPRQRALRYLRELNGSAQARWLKSIVQRTGRATETVRFAPGWECGSIWNWIASSVVRCGRHHP